MKQRVERSPTFSPRNRQEIPPACLFVWGGLRARPFFEEFMTRRLFDYNPYSGVAEYFHYDEDTDTSYIETVQDVQPHLDFCKEMRNMPEVSKKGIKAGHWLYAHLPDYVIVKMMNEDGINPYDPNDAKKLGELIESKYPYCKLTDGKHKIKGY